jgi:hypothetical protein
MFGNQISLSPFSLILFSKLTEPNGSVLAIASNAAWLIAIPIMRSGPPRREASFCPLRTGFWQKITGFAPQRVPERCLRRKR